MKVEMQNPTVNVSRLKTKIGDWVIVALCVIIMIICLLPMVNLLARSLSSNEYLIRHEVYLLRPKYIHR